VNGGAFPAYQWKSNGINISGATNATLSYAPVNNETITCQVTSSNPCATGNPALSNTLVMTTIPWLESSITITASMNPVYQGTPVTFTAAIVNGGTSPVYQWVVNGTGAGSNSSTMTYVPSNNDWVVCNLISNYPCLINSGAPSNLITMTVFTTGAPCPGLPVVSYLGQSYNTVRIGNQCWFRENLNSGNMVPVGLGQSNQFNNSVVEKYCYDGLPTNCSIYGGLYTWNEMMNYVTTASARGICPVDWHIPSDNDWTVLTTALGGAAFAGGSLKETGTSHWIAPNTGATNFYGFTGLPAGYSTYEGYAEIHYKNILWSSTNAGANDANSRGYPLIQPIC
jgi:uncharacterized protein (TIGR02145 family)